ncbi:type II toxin-antitoxin system VapC family toxin [Romeria aff. gracilis LEGE 07310]|uniref:Type II toxin-antitoxin system VapC family toxin n=1 Tax=Vasconcelosia minhoensis LEGE 07310 TaxID=915328 RepID=A0A8J7A6Q6_9CYAN|nr:type II toxin-antitoxin system VapC family toxin [Romeria gracilis]MBE9077020.1 type II toxin-antitoxin system VapC family toxin [Romeria aff. gracilis LEGE 07310]
MELLFDTNIIIYHLNNQLNEYGENLLRQGLSGQSAYSIISKIELLGFNQPDTADVQARRVLSGLIELPLTSEVAERTIMLRKRFKIKIPDAIIAATALEYSLRLITRNEVDFAKVEDLNLTNPFEAQN